MSDLSLTIIASLQPRVLSKSFSLAADGALARKNGGNLSEGFSETRRIADMSEFAALLSGLKPNHALMFGLFEHDNATVLSKEKAERHKGPGPIVTRTRDCVSWPAGPAFLMCDYDPTATSEPLTGGELLERLFEAAPALRDAPHVTRPSASSCVYRKSDGAELRGERGRRIYVAVKDGRDIERASKVLQARLWLDGHGYYAVSKSGALLDRTLIDGAVYQPERLDFAGGAACGEGLEQRLPAPEVFNLCAEFLDTVAALPNLSGEEHKRLEEIKAEARKEMEGAAGAAREDWIAKRVGEFGATLDEPDEAKRGQRIASYEQTCRAAIEDGRLFGDYEIVLDDGKRVTVGEILDAPTKYHNRKTLDPLEPDYDGGRAVGWLNLRAKGRPYLKSYAHGDHRFTLVRARRTIALIADEEASTFEKATELLRLDGALYERGGLVRVVGNKIAPVCPDWLKLHLARNARFVSHKMKKSGEIVEVPRGVPMWLAQMIVRSEGERGLPNLRAVIDAPTIDPKTGRILADDGFDEQSGLLLNMVNSDAAPKSDAGHDDARKAVETLWTPFVNFPFADGEDGPVSRGVFFSTLLTAVARRLLPTAPGFLISATAPGSGKTLLAQCVAALASGDTPDVFGVPENVSEEEMAKVVLAKALNGSATLLLDNLAGVVKSAALCAFLTAEVFEARILGASATARVPTNATVVLTGNQPVIAGDLNRRLLRCELDPACESPHKRSFSLDPLEYVQEHRTEMVRAALTIILAWHNAGRPRFTPDRLASFELWSDTIRQAVIWVGEQGWLEVADPALSIDAGFAADPDTRKLQALLSAWRGAFGSSRKAVKDLKPHLAYTESPLYDALDEIGAIERGELNSRKIGRWIEQRAGRIAGGLRLVKAGVSHQALTWRVEAVEETYEGEFDDDFGSFENETPPKTPRHNNLKNNDYSSYREFGEFSSNPYTREKHKNEKIINLDRLEKTTPNSPNSPSGSNPVPPWRRADNREGRQ